MFPANSPLNTQMCATFSIVEDNVVELPEEFLVSATGAMFSQQQASVLVIILDNDG